MHPAFPNTLLIACVKGSSDDCAGTSTTEPRSHPHLILQSPQYSTPSKQYLCSSTRMHHGYTRTPAIESAPLMLFSKYVAEYMCFSIEYTSCAVIFIFFKYFSPQDSKPVHNDLHACSHTVPVSASAVPVIPSERSRILRVGKERRLKPSANFASWSLCRRALKTTSCCHMASVR